MKTVAFLSALLLAAQLASAQTRLVVQTGHDGPAECIAYDSAHGLVFTGGADGSVRGWNPETGELVRVLQVSHLPVRMIATSPTRSQITVFISDNIGIYKIEVWDWRSKSLLFTYSLSEAPLFLTYSPAGSYVVYGVTEWNGIVFLDSQTGRLLPYFSSGFGIVGSAIISSSERSVMTYRPSGKIDYWSIDSGALKESLPTLANLTAISYTPNYLYMIGTDGSQLAVVSLLSGATVASAPLPGIAYTAVDPKTDDIVCYSNGPNGTPELSLWSFSSNALYRISGALTAPDRAITDLVFANGRLYASLASGEIYADKPFEEGTTFGSATLLPVDDVGLSGRTMLLTTTDEFLLFGSEFFSLGDASRSNELSYSLLGNPFHARTGVTSLSGGRFALWRKDSPPGTIALYGPADFSTVPINLASGIVDVTPFGSLLAALDANGKCSLLDPETGASLFSYTAFGTRALVSASDNHLIAGLARGAPFNTALLQINTSTGETVPVPSADRIVFDLAYDAQGHSLYALGVQGEGGNLRTVLSLHDVATLSGGTPLLTVRGTDLGATMAIDPASGDLYTTLGYQGVRRITPGGFPEAYTQFQRTDHIPRKLAIENNWIVTLNSDSSLSVWNKKTGKWVLDFYVFKNWSWLAILPSERFYASAGALRYLRAYEGTSTTPESVTPYQLGS